jgi:hypothetical protein
MKKNKLNQYESKTALEPSPEQIQQAKEWAVNRIMETVDKLPANPAPVAESLSELARQAKFTVPRQPTIIQTNDFSKITQAEPTKMNAKVDTGINAKVDTKNILSDSDLELLRQIQNGEQ